MANPFGGRSGQKNPVPIKSWWQWSHGCDLGHCLRVHSWSSPSSPKPDARSYRLARFYLRRRQGQMGVRRSGRSLRCSLAVANLERLSPHGFGYRWSHLFLGCPFAFWRTGRPHNSPASGPRAVHACQTSSPEDSCDARPSCRLPKSARPAGHLSMTTRLGLSPSR